MLDLEDLVALSGRQDDDRSTSLIYLERDGESALLRLTREECATRQIQGEPKDVIRRIARGILSVKQTRQRLLDDWPPAAGVANAAPRFTLVSTEGRGRSAYLTNPTTMTAAGGRSYVKRLSR